MSISKQEFHARHLEITEMIKVVALKKGGINPMIFLGKESKLYLVKIPEVNDVPIPQLVLPISTTSGADYVYFATEQWLSNKPNIRPSQDPDRIEVLTVIAEHLEHDGSVIHYQMIRNELGELIDLKFFGQSQMLGGSLSQMLCGGNGDSEQSWLPKASAEDQNFFKSESFTIH